MFLKKEKFTFNNESLMLNELSALQRISFIEFLADEEKAFREISEGLSEQEMAAKMIGMNIRGGARLIAYSLWHNDPSGLSEEELHLQVLSSWPAEAIGKAEMQVKLLSGMLAPDPADVGEDGEESGETAENETVTVEKR